MGYRIFASQCSELSASGYDHSFCCGVNAGGLAEAALGQKQWRTVAYSG